MECLTHFVPYLYAQITKLGIIKAHTDNNIRSTRGVKVHIHVDYMTVWFCGQTLDSAMILVEKQFAVRQHTHRQKYWEQRIMVRQQIYGVCKLILSIT